MTDLISLQDFFKIGIMKKIQICFIGLLLLSISIKAQELESANHFFNNKAYVKAIKLFEKEPNKTQEVYEKLADSYYYNSQMDKAAKWYEALMTKYLISTAPAYYFKYSQALKGIKEYEKADIWLKKYYNKGVSNTISSDTDFNENAKSIYEVFSITNNSSDADFGGAIYNNKLIFSSTRTGGKEYHWNNKPYLDLYQADIDTLGNLNNIQVFSPEINTKLHESNAVFTKDGQRIFFTRNNYMNGKQKKDSNKVTHLKIYSADLVGDEWKNIKELPFNGDNFSVMHPALSDDETKLYFSSDMPSSIGSFDLFEVSIEGKDNYGEPKNLGTNINTEQLEQFPFYSKDTLYFSSNRALGFGGLDIFKSYKSNQGFTKPKNLLLGINSSLDDFGYVLNEETSTGYLSSNREGGKGGDDIYRFTKPKSKVSQITGIVKDRELLTFIENARVTLFDGKDNILESLETVSKGRFNFDLEPNKEYIISVEHTKYVPQIYKFSTKETFEKIDRTILLDAYQVVDANIIVKNAVLQIDHEPIYFDLNSSYLRPDAILILDHIVSIIKKYPDMRIHYASHTDARATDEYNDWLSKRRARRSADYIISKGIDASRITNDGYGETNLVNDCYNNVPCSKAEHQLNRRTEFILQ